MKKLIIFLAVILFANDISKSFPELIQDYKDSETKSNVKQIFSRNFGLYPYKTNYLLPMTWDFDKKDDRKQFETKFQISVMKPFARNLLGKNEIYFFAYTQTSWWQTSAPSAPFRENNYEPEMFVLFPMESYHKRWDAIIFGIEHQSNGKDIPYSRSWNRVYTKFLFHTNKMIFNLRVWYRIPEAKKKYPIDPNGDDNPDIEDYMGYGDLKIMYPYKDNLFRSLIRYNPRTKKGAIELSFSKAIHNKDLFLYIQYFNGYGESLIDYNRLVNKIGIGFAYSR